MHVEGAQNNDKEPNMCKKSSAFDVAQIMYAKVMFMV
jgi:hypothetical protein